MRAAWRAGWGRLHAWNSMVCQLAVDGDGAQAPFFNDKLDICVDELSLLVLAVLGMPLFHNFKLVVLHIWLSDALGMLWFLGWLSIWLVMMCRFPCSMGVEAFVSAFDCMGWNLDIFWLFGVVLVYVLTEHVRAVI
ncbi:hypothetical protein M758_10G069700 [Ceratodon purpureus]|uniref:Uncharacterized protein n=1 Tax=Ceratodon purpureus TaxID=3225 RepID=A0A8T0GJ50_CERPU|nr:hypothetical protein KC19_10G071900 [Ceratodon purpureus]KAG0559011.1 hypothetical protein KC19_10G072000 [Ceratodon purpureus]KAG0603138.1 hypothetical protein M758_10G069600 [Ceratodon purpureus]KAG0603147.1 hypothetical protein M758_10G069700 [Ceratodon purpureus]